HSLCALDQLRSLPADLVSDALFDDDGSVRRHAVRVCPNGLLDEFEIGAGLAVTIVDSDPQVRLEAAYVFGEGPLGQAEGDTPPRFLAHLALDNGDDPYLRAAVASSVNPKTVEGFISGAFKAIDQEPTRRKSAEAVLRQIAPMANKRCLQITLRQFGAAQKR